MPIDPADLVVSIATQGKLEFECGLARTLQQVVDTAKELLGADGVGLMLADTNGSCAGRARPTSRHKTSRSTKPALRSASARRRSPRAPRSRFGMFTRTRTATVCEWY